MSHSAIIVQITTPLDFNYTKFCKDIIQKKLAACMHVFPPTESFYVWIIHLNRRLNALSISKPQKTYMIS